MNRLVKYIMIPILFLGLNLQGQYIFKNLTKDHGLGTNQINCILKDNQGFLWMGTENGLFRFDGSELMPFYNNFDDSTSLSENYILSLTQVQNGDIWIGTQNGGINVLDPTNLKFNTYNHSPDDTTSISDDVSKLLFEDNKGNIWIGVRHNGIDMFDPEAGTFLNFRPSNQYDSLDKRLANSMLCSTHEPGNKNLIWLGTLKGIFSFNIKTKIWKRFPIIQELAENPKLFGGREDIIRTLFFDQNGFLWFGSWGGGLCKMDTETGKFKIFKYENLEPVNGIRNNISKLIKKNENEFWFIAPHKGLGTFEISSGKFTFIKDNSGKTPFTSITDAIIDNDGFMYVSSYNSGLFYCNLQSQMFNRENLPYSPIAMGSSGNDSTLWVSTYSQYAKLVELNKRTKQSKNFTYKPINDYKDNNFISILNNDGEIWLGEQLNLYYFDKASSSIKPYNKFDPGTIIESKSHVHNFISASMDQNGVIWLGSKFNGLFKVNTKTGMCKNIYFAKPGENILLFNGFIFTLFTDSKNRTWFGSGNFGYFDPSVDRFITFDHFNDFKGSDVKLKHIYAYTETKDGLIWIGTQQSGIAVIDPNTQPARFVESYTMANGLQSNNIDDLQTDGQGNVWIMRPKGISRIYTETGLIENYGRDYGLVDLRRFHLEEDGEIYIVARKGYYHFYPQEISPDKIDIKPYIKNFRIFDDPIEISAFSPESKMINLDYDQNYFSIEFGVINYFEQEAVKYKFMLSGLDNQWHDAGNRKYISYTNLNGGEYTFRLKATGSKELTIPIFIQTPFWKTWWFYVLLFATITGLILYFIFYRLQQIRKHEELKTAYDKKISQLEIKALRAQMNPHFLFNSLNSIRYYILKEDHQNASEYITKFSRLLRLILTNSRHSKISLEDELHALGIYIDFELMRFDNKFEYKINIDPNINQENIKIQPMTIQPFVENAIWHGLMPKKDNRFLSVDISAKDNIIKIIIEDNGIGRQEAKQLSKSGLESTKSYGMQITEDRMQMMKDITGKMSGFKIIDLFENRHPIGTRVIITFEV